VGQQGHLLDRYLCRLCIAVELMPAAEMLFTGPYAAWLLS